MTSAAKDSIVPGKKVVNATIVNYSSYVGSRSARAIQGDKFALGDLEFYLEGVSKTADVEDQALEEVTVTDGKFTVNLDPAVWVLTLYASKSDTALTSANKLDSAVLIASAVVDLRRHNNTAAFILSAGNLTTPANVKVTVNASWYTGEVTTNYPSVKAGLYELVSGKVIENTSNTSSETALTFTSGTAIYNIASIKPGTYTFAVTFKGNSSDPKYKDEEMVWSEKIIIEPGHDIAESVTIPNLLDEPPAAPENLKAYYAKPNNEGWYALGFSWEDKSYSERYFELEVVDLTASASATTALLTTADWETTAVAKNVTLYNSDCRTSAKSGPYTAPSGTPAVDTFDPTTEVDGVKYYIAGGLEKNNTNFVIKVPTGTNYSARIRAVNLAGKSAWAYVTRATTKPTVEPAATPDGKSLQEVMKDNPFIMGLTNDDVYLFDAASKALNVYMMTYDLNGGSYKDAGSADVIENIVRFDSTSRDYITITEHLPSTDPKTYDIKEGTTELGTNLMKNGNYWSNWYTMSGDTQVIIKKDGDTGYDASRDKTYTGTKDVTLYAKYGLKFEGTVEVFSKKDYELYTDWITCTNVPASSNISWAAEADHRDSPSAVAIVPAKHDGTAASKLTWTINVSTTATPALPTGTPIKAGFQYDKVTLEISSSETGTIKIRDEIKDVKFGENSVFGGAGGYDISKWEGFYTVAFTAYYGGSIVGSKTYIMRVTN